MNGFAKSFQGQMSESFLTAGVLSLAGGLQMHIPISPGAAVFANAQTGNIVLLSQCVGKQDWAAAARYLIPVLSFALGVAIAEEIHQFCRSARRLHWRQVVLMVEIVLLLIVGFLPNTKKFAGECSGVLFLCHAGAGIPESERLCVCQYHVHRKYPQWNGGTLCLPEDPEPADSSQGRGVFWNHFSVCFGGGPWRLFASDIWAGYHMVRLFAAVVGFLLMFIPEEENQHHE